MKRGSIILLGVTVALLSWPRPLYAQEEDCGDECAINVNMAMVVQVPVNPTAQVTANGWGAVVGVGGNINKRHALIGEFMWNRMYANNAALDAIKAAVQPTGTLDGSINLFSVTGNYRYELRGRLLGGYLIAGGGWYMRTANLSQTVTVGTTTVCTRFWLWWGFQCTSGFVNENQTLASFSSSTVGANAGGGFTFRAGPAPYRFYAEARYHYAPTANVSTQFVAISMGIRY